MPRPISAAAKRAMFAREYGGAALELLTISHDALGSTPIRLARNNENVISRGETYLGFPFDITVPNDEDGRIGNAQLTIENIDRTILSALGSLTSPPNVTLEVVLSEAPDVVDVVYTFTWRLTRFDPMRITADLMFDDLLNQRYPQHDFSPSGFEGLF